MNNAIEDSSNKKNRLIRMLFFLYLLITILEKLNWRIGGWGASLFVLSTPVVFLSLLILYVLSRRNLVISLIEKKFLKYYIGLLIYLIAQIVIIDYTGNIIIQYTKGVIEYILQIIGFINLMMMINYDGKSIDFQYVSKCLYILTIINVVYCLWQNINPQIDTFFVELFHSDVVRYGTDSYGVINRPSGLFIESNFNGAFLLVGIINEIYDYSINKSRGLKKICKLIIIAFTLLEIGLTLSLSTYIGMVVFAVLLFHTSNIRNKTKIIGFGLFLATVVLYFYISNDSLRIAVDAKLGAIGSIDKLKNHKHYVIAVQALQIWMINTAVFWFGTGINCLNVYYQEIYSYSIMKAHSFYLQRLCELGIFGLLITLYYIKILFSHCKGNNQEYLFYKYMLISMLMMNFTYDSFTRNYNYLFIVFTTVMHSRNREFKLN